MLTVDDPKEELCLVVAKIILKEKLLFSCSRSFFE